MIVDNSQREAFQRYWSKKTALEKYLLRLDAETLGQDVESKTEYKRVRKLVETEISQLKSTIQTLEKVVDL